MRNSRVFRFTIILVFSTLIASCQASPTVLKPTTEPEQAVTRISYNFETPIAGTPLIMVTSGQVSPISTQRPTNPVPATSTYRVSPTYLENTLQSTETATSTPTVRKEQTRTPTLTKTPVTPTATLPTGWGGEWVVYYGSVDDLDHLQKGTMTITLNGKQMDALAFLGLISIHLVGTISADEQQVNGNYTQGNEGGWFQLQLIKEDQFGGSLGNQFAFCATRNTSDRPDPCFMPVGS